MQTTKSDTVSLRMNGEIKVRLEKESKEKGIAFNKLLCQVLTRHVRWYTMAEKMDMITMPKTAYKAYTDEIPDDKIRKIAKIIQKTNSTISFSQVVSDYLKESLKKRKAKME